MVNVCYVISQGFSARMVLHSDLVGELSQRGLATAVVSPNADEAPMRSLAASMAAELHTPAVRKHVGDSFALTQFQRYVFEDVERNPALWAKHQRDIQGSRLWQRGLARAMIWLNRGARRYAAVPRVISRTQQLILNNVRVRQQLHDMQPDVVVATYPANFIEATYLHEAQRLGIRTATHLLSWDNISCKGKFPVVAEYFVSWGPIMSQELFEYYGTPTERIFECGVPHFDAHIRRANSGTPIEIRKELHLDPERPYLFFGMSSPYFAPREIDLVEWLAGRVTDNAFGPQMQLVVRPHPQNVEGNMSDASWLARLEALRGERVSIDMPRLEPSRLAWNMRPDDLEKLAGLLAGAAICLNSGSTLSIDAIIHDRPVIITAFDRGAQLPWHRSARRLVEYKHLAKLIALGGVRVVGTEDDLEHGIRTYLDKPSTDAAGRALTRAQECGACDGRAAARVAEAFSRLLRRSSADRAARASVEHHNP